MNTSNGYICPRRFNVRDRTAGRVPKPANSEVAAVVWKRPEGYALLALASRYAPEHRDTIRYVPKKEQLHNRLSLKLAGFVKKAAAAAVHDVSVPAGFPRES